MGGSSKKPKQHAADYHMSVHYGVCTEVDSINRIWINDTLTEAIRSNVNTTAKVNQKELFGGREKQGGVKGLIDYMLGKPDQAPNPGLAQRLGVALDRFPAFRGICSIFFHSGNGRAGFMWSTNMPSLPPVRVEVTRIPEGPNGVKRDRGGHANPAHIIWECLTNTDWGMGSPLGLVDAVTFDAVADALDAEGFSLSLMWARSSTIEAFVGEILDHIQATLTTDPATGKMKLKLLRDDYSHNNLYVVHPGNATLTKMQRKVWGETTNDVQVTWTNPENEEEETVNAQDNGNISIQGAVISTTRNYYGVRNADLALRLAYRDLKQSGTPLLAIDAEVDRSGWDKIVGDVVEVRWPEYGVGSVIMRIGSINYGKSDDSKLQLSLMEDIFGLGTAVFVEMPTPQPGDPAPTYPPPPPGVDIPPYIPPYIPIPQEPLHPEVGEAPRALDYVYMDSVPYFLVAATESDLEAQGVPYPEVYGLILANQPGTATSVVNVWGDVPSITGDPELEQITRMPNAGRGTLNGPISQSQTTIPFPANWSGASLLNGQLMLLAAGTADAEQQELVAVRTVTTDADGDPVSIEVIRGVLDTNAYAWPAGTPAWGVRLAESNFDTITRYDGETVRYKFAPVTNQGTFPISLAPFVSHVMNERMHRPYRPVDLRINGLAVPPAAAIDAGATLTWARRNRLTETAQLLSQTDQDVAPEVGQTTTLVFSVPGSEETFVVSGIEGNSYEIPDEALALGTGGDLMISAYAKRGDLLSREAQRMIIKTEGSGYGSSYGFSYGES